MPRAILWTEVPGLLEDSFVLFPSLGKSPSGACNERPRGVLWVLVNAGACQTSSTKLLLWKWMSGRISLPLDTFIVPSLATVLTDGPWGPRIDEGGILSLFPDIFLCRHFALTRVTSCPHEGRMVAGWKRKWSASVQPLKKLNASRHLSLHLVSLE